MDSSVLQADQEQDKPTFLTFVMVSGSLIEESRGMAVLDSGCTATVAGEEWILAFSKRMPEHLHKEIARRDANTYVLFGGGERVRVMYSISSPVYNCGSSCLLNVFIIPGSLPLLLSIASIRKAKMIIDFIKASLCIGDSKSAHQLKVSSSGHFLLDLLHWSEATILMSTILTKADVEKLHRQFAHCSGEKLTNLIESSGFNDQNALKFVTDIVKNCDVCRQFGRVNARPVVSLPLSTEFNQNFAMDLHQMAQEANKYYLHIIDTFTRFSVAILITNKRPETIITEFVENWCLQFGFPRKILTDNGGEFNNHHFRSMRENYGCDIKCSAAFSPWSNGVVERHCNNAVVIDMFLKMRADKLSNFKDNVLLKFCLLCEKLLAQ